MRVDFELMPDHSRVWIYQADRVLTDEECENISTLTEHFLEEWTAHGSSLKSSSKIFYNRFLILTVDENYAQASGCSIDTAFKFIRYLESEFDVSFTDRTNVALLTDKENNSDVRIVKLAEIRNSIENSTIKSDTLVFNNLVTHIGQWKQEWIAPASNTWLKKYFA